MTDTAPTTPGTRARALRLRQALTVEEAAQGIGVSTQTIYRFERDEGRGPRIQTLRKIAGFYDVEPATLLPERDRQAIATPA
ncbi:helix-turn-helix transcriptional regulator [Patulibacter sp. SYSU D01012]|uniref:helix-turn-helix domain-containing protein n=1 Tax=Patulibacter sp. SYSU D01012 TaxID=2817381 RepID=UPI001B317CF1|nr:helix-turn-helix transcriptional regulator [Patulibacter sp. SYSU D01012]